MSIWAKVKCWMELHDWRTVIGSPEFVDTTHPTCKECGATYRLTQGQINQCWALTDKIRGLQRQISDIDPLAPRR